MIIEVSQALLDKIAEVETYEASKVPFDLTWSWAFYQNGVSAFGEAHFNHPHCQINITIIPEGAEIYRTDMSKYGMGDTYTHPLGLYYDGE